MEHETEREIARERERELLRALVWYYVGKPLCVCVVSMPAQSHTDEDEVEKMTRSPQHWGLHKALSIQRI